MSSPSSQQDDSDTDIPTVTPAISLTTFPVTKVITKKRKTPDEQSAPVKIDKINIFRSQVLKKLHIQKTRTEHHIKEALDRCATQEIKTWIILRLMLFVLQKHCFEFNDKFYKQISGTIMGTKSAHSNAITFMTYLKSQFFATQRLKSLVWLRYIDDIFMIWPHTRQELSSFMASLNSFHNAIKFTCDADKYTANFQDVQIRKDDWEKLHTSVYTKPTDTHMYLHYLFFHPEHLKRSISLQQQQQTDY